MYYLHWYEIEFMKIFLVSFLQVEFISKTFDIIKLETEV